MKILKAVNKDNGEVIFFNPSELRTNMELRDTILNDNNLMNSNIDLYFLKNNNYTSVRASKMNAYLNVVYNS